MEQGRTQAREYMDKIGATRRFIKRVLFYKKGFDAVIDLEIVIGE